MYSQIRKFILLLTYVLMTSLFSCKCGSSDPVNRRLDMLESTIKKYEAKAKKGGLTEMEIRQLNSELDAIGTEIPENATVEQHQRLMQISDREDKLEERELP